MEKKHLTPLPPEELFTALAQLLEEGYDAEFTVTGNSMWPLLRNRLDSVTLRKVDPASLQKGDIVFLKLEQGYLLHRITHIKSGQIQTAGDGNCYYDGYISTQALIGRVVGFTRKGRYVPCSDPMYRLSSNLWRWLFFARPLLLRFLSLFRRQRK